MLLKPVLFSRYYTSALIYAAREGRPAVIECLVKAGANIDKQDSRGYTVGTIITNYVTFLSLSI